MQAYPHELVIMLEVGDLGYSIPTRTESLHSESPCKPTVFRIVREHFTALELITVSYR